MSDENKEYEVDELVQLYERLVENINQFSADAEIQINKLKGFAVADEIASDMSDIAKPYANILFQNEWISQEQIEIVENIDEKLNEMSRNKELWSEEALIHSEEWKECRMLGRNLLKLLEQWGK